MPRYDIYHDTVKNALLSEEWTITHEPLYLRYGRDRLYVDLGAEKIIVAEKDKTKIAVEIKSFVGSSAIDDLEKAMGQYVIYKAVLEEKEPVRQLYLAVPKDIFENILKEELG